MNFGRVARVNGWGATAMQTCLNYTCIIVHLVAWILYGFEGKIESLLPLLSSGLLMQGADSIRTLACKL